MPALLITGTRDSVVPPGLWESTSYSRSRDGSSFFYTGSSAIIRSWGKGNNCEYTGRAQSFDEGYDHIDCRTYCSEGSGWTKGKTNYAGDAGQGWPKVLDCRMAAIHDPKYEWTWSLILDFFDAHST